ncbi:sugar isomerase [Devosia pacifica]|uniref:Sugar isomerase n=1 Tax=Devosia pacifica TaxID=1335967 RepID=A0A918S9J0_9HYPH|nr:hypothetical protein [Devosia pacifica]GHA29938.1 sugar isomerase [Devosia pacifica]
MSSEYPKREWIPAHQSFDGQAEALVGMVDTIAGQLDKAPERPQRLSIIGIGASHAAAAVAARQFRADGIDATRLLPSELFDDALGHDGLALYISQSGRSAEVVAVAKANAPEQGFAITNYEPSPLADLCSGGLNLGNHPDSSVSFVSFTGTMLALGMLADHWAGRSDPDGWKHAIRDAMTTVTETISDLRALAEKLVACPSSDIVAPASIVSVAEEAALMLREGPRLMSTGMETRQYLHGPMDAAGKAMHLVFGGAREALLIDQLAEQTQNLVYVTGPDGGAPKVDTLMSLQLPVPLGSPIHFAIGASFVTQMLTLLASEARGIDINEAVFVRLDTKTNTAG